MIVASEYIFRYAVILVLQAVDILSGIFKTKRNGGKLKSAKMASGLYKKMGTILAMVAADVLAVVAAHEGIGFNICKPVFLYIVAMEALSVYENADDAGLLNIFKKYIKKEGADSEL
jgi:phage-related holin